jgi:CheY-like chemotaxis protein
MRDILVVGDDDTGVATVTKILVRAGYEVERTRPGPDTFSRVSGPDSAAPDLLVISIAEPLDEGIGALRSLRETLDSQIPVVVLAPGITPEQEEEIRGLGVSALLPRTTPSESLLAAVRDALRQP